jgi:predicted GIY-YIG superfamily endonuclease
MNNMNGFVLERRIDEHNNGKVKYTKNLRPWKLKFFKKI